MLAYDSAGSPSPTSIFSYPPSPTVVLAFLPCIQAAYGFAKQKLFDLGAEAIIRFATYRIRRRLQQHQEIIQRRRPGRRASREQNNPPNENENENQDQDQPNPDAAEQPQAEDAIQAPVPQVEPAAPAERPPVSFLFTSTLLFPFISSAAGTALLSLSHHFPAVRTLIGLRRNGREMRFARPIASTTGLGFASSFLDRLTAGGPIMLKRAWGWEDFEPVWWRNVLGYAIYVVIHDAWDLAYAWLRVTERRSRKVVDRAFEGVDLASLDLRDSWRMAG